MNFTTQILSAVAGAGEKGIDSVDLITNFPDETNAADFYEECQKLWMDGLILKDIKTVRVQYQGTFARTRYKILPKGRAELERAGGGDG